MRLPGRLIALLALFVMLPLQAAEVRGHLREPRPGALLRGGTVATIDWVADDVLPSGADEWEAFLSVDGGAFYAYRITPHLTLDRRHFTFIVPNVATDHARILIRAGNEREEIEVALEGELAIAQDPFRALAAPNTHIDEEARGESARPGDRGVIEWVEGDRRGEHVEVRSALQRENIVRDADRVVGAADSAEAVPSIPVAREPRATSTIRATERACPQRQLIRDRAGREVLRANRRLNI